MKLFEIRDILKAEFLVGEDKLNEAMFAAGSADLMADVLSSVAQGAVLLSGLTTEQIIRTAKISKIGAVVIVRGKRPDKAVLDLAESYDMPILLTDYSLFVASGRLYMHGLRGLDGSW